MFHSHLHSSATPQLAHVSWHVLFFASRSRAQAMVPPAASAAYRRRILLDIGAREFESSVAWFLHAYPGPAFDDIYAFEMLPHTFAVPAAPALRHRFGDRARPFETNRFHFQVRDLMQ